MHDHDEESSYKKLIPEKSRNYNKDKIKRNIMNNESFSCGSKNVEEFIINSGKSKSRQKRIEICNKSQKGKLKKET